MVKRQEVLSVSEAFAMFKAVKATRGAKTVFNYEQSFSFFVKDNGIGEDTLIKSVTFKTICGWIEDMKERGLKVSSINHYLGDIRVFLYWCMSEGYMSSYKISLVKGQKPAPKFYTDEEIEVLIKKPKKSELFSQYRAWVVICFILATGARASTLVNIKISDIDFVQKEILYRHLKNKSVAIIPLSKSLEKVLRDYLHDWKREKEDGWLFCDSSERQCTVSALHQSMENYCNRRGIKSRGLHALRHSFARGYILNGGSAFKLQKILTHSTIEMTKRYVTLFSDDLKTNYEQFSPLDSFSGGGKVSRK